MYEYCNSLLSEFNEKIAPRLKEIAQDTERFLYFIAWLNTRLESWSRGRIILVGGFAVEILTGATYRTLDVDIIVEGSKDLVEEFLKRISEPRTSRVFVPKLRALANKGIDIVGSAYSKVKEPIRIEINEYYVYMEPCEELILTYLSAWKFWGSLEDRDKVYALVKVYWNRIDRSYILKEAAKRNTEDKLKEILSDLGVQSEI